MIFISIDFATQLSSTFVSKVITMPSISLHSKKTILAVAAFVLFWIVTFAYVLPIKFVRKKTPNLAWQYDQLFGQKWNFFTQPSLANNHLYFVLKNTATNQITDSVDVLRILWDDKISKVPFNTKEDVLDHISLRQITSLNEAIYYHNSTENAVKNLAAFGKLMIEKKGRKLDNSMQFKVLLFEEKIKPFNDNKPPLRPQLIFESSYQYLK